MSRQPLSVRPVHRPTMTDVAKEAGVSQSTVSMVLNNMSGARLSADTRVRVFAAAARLGYRLSRRESPLGDSPLPRNMVVYLVDEISTSPHPVVSVDGARDAAWEHGCLLSVLVTRSDPEQQAAIIESLKTKPSLVGLVYSTIFTREVEVPKALCDWPLVLLNCHTRQFKLPSVVPAEVDGGYEATLHLLSKGHRRIGFVNGEPWMEAAKDRLKGYKQALAEAGIEFDAALVRDGDWMSGTGFDASLSLLQNPRRPTALFCANDLMALGAMEAARHLGLRVPEDISVMGYDDQEISRHTHPPLTTMVLPNYDMGRAAVLALLRVAAIRPQEAGEGRRSLIKVPCPLVERDTVASP